MNVTEIFKDEDEDYDSEPLDDKNEVKNTKLLKVSLLFVNEIYLYANNL